jgi:hypothetical protein
MACARCGSLDLVYLMCSLCLILMFYLFARCNTCHKPGTRVYVYYMNNTFFVYEEMNIYEF